MIQFYAPDILATGQLPPAESAHCVRVLRMGPGDPVRAVDGRGGLYDCRLAQAGPRGATVEILQSLSIHRSWTQRITVAVAPTKNADRMEWLVEKLTEMGVDAIVPVLCHRSERPRLNLERLQRVAVSAMKQSLKAWLPTITPLVPLQDLIDGDAAPQRYFGYCSPQVPRLELARAYCPGTDVTVVIGPEGDFTPAEVQAMTAAGYRAVTMGPERLRTETAALDACATVHAIDLRELPAPTTD